MKLNEWLQIAEIVSTVLLILATVMLTIVTYNAHRDPQRTPLPWSIHLLRSPWIQSPWRLPPLSILIYLVLLTIDLRSTAPVSRGAVFAIALHVAGVFWGAMWTLTSIIGLELRSQSDAIGNLQVTQSKIANMIQNLNLSQAEVDRSLLEAVKAVAPGEAFRKMIEVMELMNAELEKVKQKTERRTGIAGLFRR
jgi:hypothetical protein